MSNGYRRGYQRTSRPIAPGRFGKANARPGPCHYCGEVVPAGQGQLYREDGAWSVAHLEHSWKGSPISGMWINGCPADTATLNGTEYTPAAPVQADPGDDLREVSRRAGSKYAYTNTGARMSMRCGHVDYPCCGCDD